MPTDGSLASWRLLGALSTSGIGLQSGCRWKWNIVALRQDKTPDSVPLPQATALAWTGVPANYLGTTGLGAWKASREPQVHGLDMYYFDHVLTREIRTVFWTCHLRMAQAGLVNAKIFLLRVLTHTLSHLRRRLHSLGFTIPGTSSSGRPYY